MKGDVRSLEGDDTLLRPLLKITSGKNLAMLSDCRGVDYSIILLLLFILLWAFNNVCHTTYLFVDIVAYPGFGSTDRYIYLLPVFSSLGHKKLLGPLFVSHRTVRAIVCVAKSMIETFSLEFVPSGAVFFVLLHSNVEQ